MAVGVDDRIDIQSIRKDQKLASRISSHALPPVDDLLSALDGRCAVGSKPRPVRNPFRRISQEGRGSEGVWQDDEQVATIEPVPVLQDLVGRRPQLLVRICQGSHNHGEFVGIGSHGFQVGIHGEKHVAGAGEAGTYPFLQGFHAPALPQETVTPARSEIGYPQPRKRPQSLDLLPHLRLGPRIEHVESKGAHVPHGCTRAQLVDDGERRDLPHRGFHPATVEVQLILAIALGEFVFRQLEGCEPVQELRFEDLLAPIEGVTGKPDHLLLRQVEATRVVQLLTQFPLVDLLRQAYRLRPVDKGEGCIDVRIELPDHLQHQELVEIGIDQAANDRVELPGVIVNPGGDIGLRHACPALAQEGRLDSSERRPVREPPPGRKT